MYENFAKRIHNSMELYRWRCKKCLQVMKKSILNQLMAH